ncbi:MAG: CRTAC1 family protein [candidate division KSB1 bacterium]|nr:CRTAC1 family protein [candidate division KSB1 bacterium]MDZ7367293.1 CRTAC1 family protein [candidate division KSB1 bacterium]MDZ7405868.1 CRTAC1 family protein [candidate division KSB1 bacterium]
MPKSPYRENFRIMKLIAVVLALIVIHCEKKPGGSSTKNFREGAVNNDEARWFTDVTASASLRFRNINGDPEQIPIIDQNGQGAAFLDYDNDGWLDLYLPSGSTIARWKQENNPGNRLYRNNGDGTFTDVTEQAGVRGNAWSMGCAAADYDGDGFVDLYVTNWGANVLYHNNGDGTFSDVTKQAGVGDSRWSSAATFGDVDKDGDLDLYVSNYVKFDPDNYPRQDKNGNDCVYKGVRTGCEPLLYEGEADVLYRNNGDGTFTDMTEAAGLGATAGFRGFGVILADLDLDNDLDLYVGCDMMPNLYFLNRGDGTFIPAEDLRGGTLNAVGKHESSMGVAIGDMNDDGFPDIFCTNFAEEKNTLYQNFKGFLTDVSEAIGLVKHQAELGWGTVMADFDNDSFLDIAIANGHIYPQVDQLGLAEDTYRQPRRLYRGKRDGTQTGVAFQEIGEQQGWKSTREFSSRGVAAADYDNDGDVDLLIVNHNDSPTLLRNEQGGNYLTLSLEGAGKNKQGIGARVMMRVAGRTIWRFACPNQGYLSSHDPRLHFGLGDATNVQEIVVHWPAGTVDRIAGPIAANRSLKVKEMAGVVGPE